MGRLAMHDRSRTRHSPCGWSSAHPPGSAGSSTSTASLRRASVSSSARDDAAAGFLVGRPQHHDAGVGRRRRSAKSARVASIANPIPAFMSSTPGPRSSSPTRANGMRCKLTHRPDRVEVTEKENLARPAAELSAHVIAGRGRRRSARTRPPIARQAVAPAPRRSDRPPPCRQSAIRARPAPRSVSSSQRLVIATVVALQRRHRAGVDQGPNLIIVSECPLGRVLGARHRERAVVGSADRHNNRRARFRSRASRSTDRARHANRPSRPPAVDGKPLRQARRPD